MEIKVQGKNKKYNELLLLNYCGKFSDLTTFLLFKYEYYLFYKTDTYFSSNMNKLASDSLTHLDIFGKLILLLGGKPDHNTFKINELFYETNKEKIILYTNHLNQIEDQYIKEILTNFIIEERKNLEIVELLQIKYKREHF